MGWERIDDHYTMQPGENYRLTWILQSPYPGSMMRGMIESGIKGVEKLKGMTVQKVDWLPPNEVVYIPKQTVIGRYQPWEMDVYVTKGQANFIEAGGVQDIWAVIGLIAAVLVGLGIISVLARTAEVQRFLVGTPAQGGKPAQPGVIPETRKLAIVAVIGIALIAGIFLIRKVA